MNDRVILGLDISARSTGWAVFKNEKLDDYGLIETSAKISTSARLSQFEKSLIDILDKFKPDSVIIEDIYRGPSAKTFKILSFFHGIAYKTCFDKLEQDPQVISVSATRKLIGDNVNRKCSSKEEAFEIINRSLGLGFSFREHNDIVDACALVYGYFISNEIKPQIPLTYTENTGVVLNGSLQDIGYKKRRQQRRGKKSIQKAGKKISPRSKS